MPFNDDTFLELKDCIFIKGLPTNASVKISDVREYFEQRIGECCVEMTALSKDKRWFFVAIKFKSPSVAEKVLERYGDNYICGHRVTMSYWRVPRSMTHSGQLLPNSYWGHKPNTRRWEHRENCDDEDDVCVRHEEDYSRERLSWDTNHAPSDPACRNERDNYDEELDNFRDYQENNGRYKASDNYSYEEQVEDYLPQRWDSGELEGGYYDDNRSGWDSDYNDSSENFSEREQYEKEEELSYHHEEHIWQESEVIQDNDQNFIDQTERWDYDRRYPELDTNREIYKEPYEGSLREEHGNGEYHGYQERPSEETSYRTENLCERNRDWYGGREHSGTQDLHIQRQENSQNRFSQFDHTNHWPKWEVVAPENPTRRRLSDPDVLQEARRHNAWEQSRDLTGRKPGDFVEERPRSDEWLNSNRRHFQRRGRHSTSPVNLGSKDDSHQGFARSEEIRKSSHEPFDSRTFVDRKHGGDFVHSMRSHCSNSPVRGKRSSPNTSKRSSSSERSSDFKLHETSPRSEKSSHSCSEHSSGTRQRDSRSYSPKGRHNNNRVPYDRGNAERTGTRRDCDLRRSLMLHQQRKHLSSLPRDRSREEGSKRSSLERVRKSSPDEHYRSSGSISSTDSTSPPKGGNRKRQHEDEKIRQDMETAKKRKQTSHSSLTHSDTASRDNESTKNKAAKSSSESRKQPPGEQKRSTRKPRDQLSSDNSNTGRANRLLSDLAATLAEDNISLKRPSPDTDVAQRKVESTGGHAVKSQRYTTRSKEYHKKCHPEEDEEMKQAVSEDNLQLVDSNGGDSCAKETVSEMLKASERENSTPMSRTTPLAAPSIGGNSDQDMKEVMRLYDRATLPAENSHNAEKSASSPKDKFQALKLSPKHTMIWSNSDQDSNEATRFYEGDSAQLPEENSQKTEKSAPFPKDKFQPAPEQPMLWDNSDQEVNEATEFCKDIRTTLPRNIAFSPKGKLRSLKPSPEPLEFADIKTNSTYIVDDFEKACELVDKTVVSSNRKEFEPLNPCLEHHDFAEIRTNGTFIVDDFENAYKLGTIENGVSFKKTSGVELLGQGGDGNSQTENCHVVDMEVSSDHQASPNLIQARNEFSYPADTRNAGKGSVSNTGEDECISKEASGDLTTTEQKKIEVEEFSLSGTGSVLYHTKPSMSSTEVSQVGKDTLKQGAYNTKDKASVVENTGTNNNGSCLLYTEPSIYTVQINDNRVDTLTQGSNNIKDCNGVNNRKRTTCAVKKQDLNAIYTEQELSNCNSDELIKESRDFDSNPQDVSDMKHASIDVSSQKKIVHELNETPSDANCQDKLILKIGKDGHTKVTQEVCHDSEVGHIYSTVTEGCNMEDAIINSTEQKFSAVESINNVQGKRRDDKRQDTGRETNGSSVFSDKHQRRNNDKEEDENETNSNNECSSWKCIKSVATRRDQKSYDKKSIDVIPNKKGTSDAHNIETNAGNTRIVALNTERGVCGIESSDSTSCLSNAIQEGYNEKNIDCDIVIAKKQKCDNGQLKMPNIVTQQKRHFSKNVYPSGNARQVGNSYVMQKEMHLSKELIPGRVMQEFSETNVSYVGLKPQKMFNTDCPRFSVNIPEQAGDYSKISKVDPGIVKRRSSWPSVDPYQSNAADTNKSATSSLNSCKAVHGLQKTKDLVPESFEHLDMEISSDEEHQPRLTDSAIRVVDGDSARKNDASKPYSPSSPTRKSDERCSPHAKEDYSPYSPSHPTNVSEGDLEQNDPVKELCFDEKDDVASTCEAREEIIAGGFALKNSFKGIEAARKERNTNTTVFKQAINSDGIGVTSVNSAFTLSSSHKSKSGPSLRVSPAEGSVDMSMPVDDATQCGGEKTNSECNKSDGKGGAACVVNLTADGNGEDMKKPSMRCPKRTQSLPTFSSVVPRPKVMYITATKTKHVKTDSGSLHKSRIVYAANDRIAKPVYSLSLDEMPSKDCIFGESSSHDPKNIKGPIVFETRQSNERKTVRDVKPVVTKRSGNSDTSLKLENITTQVSDLDMGKVGTPSKNAKTKNVLKVSAIEGCSFTGSMASIDKEKVDIFNTSVTEQDSEEECSRAILKDKDTASGAAHFVQDTLCKDTVAHDEAGNLMTTIKGTETADFKVLPTSYSIASGGFDESVDKEINHSNKNCSGTPPTSIEDISSFGSVPEGEQTLVSKELKERTSLCSYSTSFRVEGSMTEVYSNCNHKVPEGIKRDTNCGSVDTPVTCEMIDKRPITSTCEMTKYGHDNNQTLLLGTYDHVESTVLEGEVGNRKDEIDKESLSNVPEQHVRTVQTLPTSSSRSGKKRSHPDQRKPSHPCKVPNKSLKLIIPSHQVFNGGANRAAKPGVSARKTSSCTVTRADLHFVPGNNGDPTNKLDTGAKEDMFASLNPRGNEKPRAKNLKKPASCTITSADLDFVPGNKSLPINESDMLTVDRCGIVNSELSSPSDRSAEIESGSRSQGWHSTTGNTSPLSRHLALHNQHNETSHSSVRNIRIQEHREKGVLTEGKASFAGKESDWAALKMEQLRKKKEEIEQVYKRECQTVINVVKMLVSNDPRLEGVLQNAVRRSLQEMGQRCVQELEKEARPAT